MFKKFVLILTFLIGFSSAIYAAEDEFDTDQFCKEKLKGMMSVETCAEECKRRGYICGLAMSYDADKEEGIDADVDCFACRKHICADFGRLDAAGRTACDANPDKKSLAAPPLPDGTLCWQCIDKKDTCSDKWAGTTVQTSCDRVCPKGTHSCIKVGRHDGNDCYACRAIVPPPPPPVTCAKMGLLVAGQCGTCKDPTPICVGAGVVAVNGPCFMCVPKPKIQCSDYGLQSKCQCAADEVVKKHIITKMGPHGVKVRKTCCECVKKPKQCIDINLYTKSQCKKACVKPGKCLKVSRSQKSDCYDCISPRTCEEDDFSTSCSQCYAAGQLCRDVTTVNGVKCKECYDGDCRDLGFENDCENCRRQRKGCQDVSPLNAPENMICKECFDGECPEYGLPGDCPGTCRRGELCIKHPGSCHLCMRPKTIEVTYVIIIIETPWGRYVLDKQSSLELGEMKVNQMMVLGKVEGDAGAKTLAGRLQGDTSVGALSSATSSDQLSLTLGEGLEKGRKYTVDCFERNFEEERNLPQTSPAFSGESAFGEDTMKNISTSGPVLVCGEHDGKKALGVFDAHGRKVDIIHQEDLEKNPDVIKEAMEQAQFLSDEALETRAKDLQSIPKAYTKIKKKTQSVDTSLEHEKSIDEEIPVEPNDPFYRPPAKVKKKKKFLGIVGSNKKAAQVSIGSALKMGGKQHSAGGLGGQSRDKHQERMGEFLTWQWGLHKIGFTPVDNVNSAWNLVDEQNDQVVVAVIDSGFDFLHEDSPQNVWVNQGEVANNGIDDDANGYVDDVHGWNFMGENNDLTDLKGHGSFVAGIIAAKSGNEYGMAGIHPGATIMPVKAANSEGKTNSFHIFRAIFYAVDNGADIINISLGGRVPSRLEELAFNYAYHRGVFVVASSGNVGEDIQMHGPASEKGAFAVGSLDQEGNRSTISNWGANNALIAPGDEIISLIALGTGEDLTRDQQERGFYSQSGTSFSAPMVAATASLLKTQNPNLTNIQIEDILHRSAVDMYDAGWDGTVGAGLLNATAALSENVDDRLTVKMTEIRQNKNVKKKLESVDVFGTVRGDFKSFIVELGKGKLAKEKDFKQVAGPYMRQAHHDWIVRLDKKEHLRGSRDWVVRIVATMNNGTKVTARTLLLLK